jgi:hypothetical protein
MAAGIAQIGSDEIDSDRSVLVDDQILMNVGAEIDPIRGVARSPGIPHRPGIHRPCAKSDRQDLVVLPGGRSVESDARKVKATTSVVDPALPTDPVIGAAARFDRR